MSEKYEIDYLLTVNVEDAATQFRQLERLLFRSLSLMRRLGLPENIEEGVMRIQRLISLLRMLRVTLTLMQTAAGPIGWATALVSLGTVAFTAGDFITEINSH